MSKVIILDVSVFSFKAAFQYELAIKYKAGKDTFILPSHYTYFSSIISCLKKINVAEDDIVILAVDNKSWRKEFSSEYKSNRKEKREQHLIDWDKHFWYVNKINQEIDNATHFHVLNIPRCEADDICAVAARTFKDKEVIICSIDSDLHQLCYYCLSEDTEVLTLHGWKKYNEVSKGDQVASFNQDKNLVEYKPITWMNIYPYKGQLKQIKTKSLDILCTENHEFPIKRKKRINGNRQYINFKTVANDLRKDDNLYYNANKFEYTSRYSIGIFWAELVGWFISEGSISRNKNEKWVKIAQSYKVNSVKCNRIKQLLEQAKIPYKIYKRNTGEWDFYLTRSPFVDWIFKNVYQKELNEFLIQLPQNELKALFDGLILGDGTQRKKGMTFYSNNLNTTNWFQILALKLGYSVNTSLNVGIYRTYLSSRKNQSLRHAKITDYPYNGIVWCPTIKNNKNFIAKRNGKIFISGNSNVKFFNLNFKTPKGKGGYIKVSKEDALKILDKKVRKGDVSDNIIVYQGEDENDALLRKTLVNLLELPEDIEKSISEVLTSLPEKQLCGGLPFPDSLAKRFPDIYNPEFKIEYDYCLKLQEKRDNLKKKKDALKRELKKKEKENGNF